MKKSSYFFLLIIIAVGCQSRSTQERVLPNTTAIATILDVTDKKKLWPLADPILQIFHCDKSPDDEYYFHLSIISDKKLNPVRNVHLPPAGEIETQNTSEDPQFRNKAVVQFYRNVREAFTTTYAEFDTTKAVDYSECFSSICQQLQWLQQTRTVHKYLLIYSDLNEKSNLYNAYRGISNADTITLVKLFEATTLLPNQLNGITVYFVYQPITREEDERFGLMSSIYRQLLIKHGASVIIQANNKTYNL